MDTVTERAGMRGYGMSSWFDLKPRLEAGIGAEKSLHVESVYRNCPLPGWLQKPMDSVRRQCRRKDGRSRAERQGQAHG